MNKKTGLTPQQAQFVEANHQKLGVREIAKKLGLPRAMVKEYLDMSQAHQPAEKKTERFLYIAGLVFLTFISFSSALGNGFVWDDDQMTAGDPTLEHIGNFFKTISKPLGFYGEDNPEGALWRPIETATFFMDTFIWKKIPFGFHLTNVILHCLVAVLVFFFIRRFLKTDYLSFLAAAIYAVHPIHSESVAYIPSRGEILFALFILVSFLSYGRYPILSWFCFLLSMYSKETGVVFLGILVAYDSWILKRKDNSSSERAKRYGPYLICMAIYFMTRFYVIGGLGTASKNAASNIYLSWPNRFWIQPVYFAEYFKMIFWPADLHTWRQVYFPQRFFDPAYFISFVTLMTFVVLGILSWKRSRMGFFGLIWFVLFLFPVLNLLVIVNRSILEHWLYVPFIGFVIFVFSLVQDLFLKHRPRRVLIGVLAVVIGLLLSVVTFKQNQTWRDGVTLFEYTTRYVTRDPLLYSNLGIAYSRAGDNEKAVINFKKALSLDPNFKDAMINLKSLENQS